MRPLGALLSALVCCLPALAAELVLGAPREEGGLRAYDVRIEPGNGDAVAGLQAEVILTGGASVVEVVAGTAATGANKQVLYALDAQGGTLMVAGFNQTSIAAGPVATIYTTPPHPNGTATGLGIAEVVLSGPQGERVQATLRIERPPKPDEDGPDDAKEDGAGYTPTEPQTDVAAPGDGLAPGTDVNHQNHLVADTQDGLALLAGILRVQGKETTRLRASAHSTQRGRPRGDNSATPVPHGPRGTERQDRLGDPASRPEAPIAISRAIAHEDEHGESGSASTTIEPAPGASEPIRVALAQPGVRHATGNVPRSAGGANGAAQAGDSIGLVSATGRALDGRHAWVAAMLIGTFVGLVTLRRQFTQGR